MSPTYDDPEKEARYLAYCAKLVASKEKADKRLTKELIEFGHMDNDGKFIKIWVRLSNFGLLMSRYLTVCRRRNLKMSRCRMRTMLRNHLSVHTRSLTNLSPAVERPTQRRSQRQ